MELTRHNLGAISGRAVRLPMVAPWVQAAAGGLALVLGGLIYALDRGGGSAAHLAGLAGMAGATAAPWFGSVGGWLPSLLHPFAFSLFTAALRAPGAPPATLACAAWGLVNVVFELGQHPRVGPVLAAYLESGLGAAGGARALADYFVRGRFDPADLAAAVAGAGAAAIWLRVASPRKDRHAC
jgi:hypothetical protein